MKKLLIALTAAIFVLTACQKEASFEDPNAVLPTNGGTGGTTTTPLGLLVRVVEVGSSDSTMLDYGYDGSKRFITYNYSNTSGDFVTYRLYRNASGVITKFSYKDSNLPTYGLDSLVYNVNYDNANSRYASSVVSFMVSGITIADSLAFTYTGSDLTAISNYSKLGPSTYRLSAKTNFTYASGNVATQTYYADTTATQTGSVVLTGTYTYTYDSKVNPLKIGAEALIVMDDASLFGNNNQAVTDYVDASNASNNYRVTTTFQYNTSNKPSGGTNVETPASTTTTLRYYYN